MTLVNVTDEVASRGFAFCEALSPITSTAEIAQTLGEPIPLGMNSPVHVLIPKSTDEAASNTYSGNYGLDEFPLHTDMANWHEPPRYLLLRCLIGTADVTTSIVDPRPAMDAIGINCFTRALMKPRRRVAGRMSLLPIAQPLNNVLMVRWDERYLKPASRAGELCAAEMSQRLRRLATFPVALARPGDTVVIDNWKMLHGRSAVPEDRRFRRVERVYLKALK